MTVITPSTNLSDVMVITYVYDPLYRLTGATYSGAISATYAYAYDGVGNMTAYTETVTSTKTVTHTFDVANRLESSGDGSGTSSYSYDGNGNLLEVDGPGTSSDLRYGYNQRNLLITHTIYSGTGYVLLAEYGYDGDGTRLQQVDYSSGTPITTTYTNDIVGLSQVLLADNGTAQTKMLYGLDLIGQDNGSQTRLLLTDGLGSTRMEMVGSQVETTSTYEPYGKLLVQTGSSGTVYGYTGEAHDASTGLVFLRARYYSPDLKLFLSRDPYSGSMSRPSTLHGY